MTSSFGSSVLMLAMARAPAIMQMHPPKLGHVNLGALPGRAYAGASQTRKEAAMRAVAVLDVGIKIALVAAIVFMSTQSDLPQFENKSLTLRAVLYPIFSLAVAASYYLKGKKGDYPHLLDVL